MNEEIEPLTEKAIELKQPMEIISIIRQFTVESFIEIVIYILLEKRLLFYGEKTDLVPAIY